MKKKDTDLILTIHDLSFSTRFRLALKFLLGRKVTLTLKNGLGKLVNNK